jgi:hypothetical protein
MFNSIMFIWLLSRHLSIDCCVCCVNLTSRWHSAIIIVIFSFYIIIRCLFFKWFIALFTNNCHMYASVINIILFICYVEFICPPCWVYMSHKMMMVDRHVMILNIGRMYWRRVPILMTRGLTILILTMILLHRCLIVTTKYSAIGHSRNWITSNANVR